MKANSSICTKVVYYLDDDPTPYLIKLNIDCSSVTFGDVKDQFVKSNYNRKCFFKSLDPDFGFVKEEISNPGAKLPSIDGQIVCWLVTTDKSVSDTRSQIDSPTRDGRQSLSPHGSITGTWQRTGNVPHWTATSDIGSMSFIGSNSGSENRERLNEMTIEGTYHDMNHMMDNCKVSNCGSMTDSNASLNVITVTLSVGANGCLGIGLCGVSNCPTHNGKGVFVGSIQPGSPAAIDGQISVGDMILEVNGTALDGCTSSVAIRALQQAVLGQSLVTLVVAKSSSTEHLAQYAWTIGCEPTVTPSPWQMPLGSPCPYESLSSTGWPSASQIQKVVPLTADSDPVLIVRAMARPNSGLKISNRCWLKITIPNAFIGSDLISWLLEHIEGLSARRDAKKLAAKLLKANLIQHIVHKSSFSKKCYYVFGKIREETPPDTGYVTSQCTDNIYSNPSDLSQFDCGGVMQVPRRRISGSATGSTDSSVGYRQRDVSADQTPLLRQTYQSQTSGSIHDQCSVLSVHQPPHLHAPSLADAFSTSCDTDVQQRHYQLPSSCCSQPMQVIGQV